MFLGLGHSCSGAIWGILRFIPTPPFLASDDIPKTDAGRITKLDVEMFQRDSWKCIILGLKGQRSRLRGTETLLAWVMLLAPSSCCCRHRVVHTVSQIQYQQHRQWSELEATADHPSAWSMYSCWRCGALSVVYHMDTCQSQGPTFLRRNAQWPWLVPKRFISVHWRSRTSRSNQFVETSTSIAWYGGTSVFLQQLHELHVIIFVYFCNSRNLKLNLHPACINY